MAKAQTSEVAKKANGAVVIAASFEADAAQGFEQMGQDDLALPFLKILTNMSPEIGEVDGASPGMLYNSVTGDLFGGTNGIVVIPCAYVRQFIEWAPRGQGSSAPINIHPATSDILSKTHREPGESKDFLDNGNYVETTANHYVMYIDKDGVPNPALIVMKSTQLKKSRKWNSMMMSVQLQGANGLFRPPMFSQQYRLTVVSESNDRGKWHGWEIERIGSVEDSGVYQSAKAFAESINAGQVNVKHEKEGGAAGGNTHTHF